MRPLRWLAATIVVVLIVAAGTLVWTIVSHGISARDQPTAPEVFIARRLRHLAIPSHARNQPNPVPNTPETLAAGLAHFADHCATCHGNNGSGETPLGRNLYPKAPDMRLPATQDLADGELFAIIENGVRLTGMPAWGDGSPDSQRDTWTLVRFIRHLPKLSEQELQQMSDLNPKTREEFEEEEETRKFLAGESPDSREPSTPPAAPHHH